MLEDIIAKREIRIHHLLTASLLGSGAELGLLNQVTITLMVRNAGRHIAEFLKVKTDVDCAGQTPTECVHWIMAQLDVAKEYDVKGDKERIDVAVPTDLCRYCPKGVAGAEFLGTACPLPGLIEAILRKLVSKNWSLVEMDGKKHFLKEGAVCRFAYQLSPEGN